MKITDRNPMRAVQVFEPDINTVYTTEAAGSISSAPRRGSILVLQI
jgi:hypothetical protein